MVARHNPPLIAARSFEAAARHKSFLKAAEELHVTPTAISHQVRRLEEYLGQALFVRLNRAVELTAAGAALALTLQDIFVRLEAALDPQQHRARSTIVISVLPSLAAKWLAPRLPDFEARFPQWQVRLDVSDTLTDFSSGPGAGHGESRGVGVDRGPVDIALRYGAGKYPGLHTRRWMSGKIFPVCCPDLLEKIPLNKPSDLRRHTLIHNEIVSPRGHPPSWEDWLHAAGVDRIDATRGPLFSNTYMAIEAALAGHGVVLAPAPLVERDLANGRLVKPLDMEMDNPYAFWIVCPRQNLQDEKVKALTAWLLQQAKLGR